MYAFLCDENGTTLCGSDGVIRIDGRLSQANRLRVAREYRERFKKHFPMKYQCWTHCFFAPNIRDSQPTNIVKIS